jgi:hypothetical protein
MSYEGALLRNSSGYQARSLNMQRRLESIRRKKGQQDDNLLKRTATRFLTQLSDFAYNFAM